MTAVIDFWRALRTTWAVAYPLFRHEYTLRRFARLFPCDQEVPF